MKIHRIILITICIITLVLVCVVFNKSFAFKNCEQAEFFGVNNITQDELGYSPLLDRDGDNYACEK